MKTGSGKLEASPSPSHFLFSVDHPPGNNETENSPNGRWKIKKKTPSDLRRDARRREKFLELKRNSCQLAASSFPPPSSTDLKISADLSNLSAISETPMLIETSEDMENESSEQPGDAIPERDDTRNGPIN